MSSRRPKHREQIVANVRRSLAEIDQFFIDAEYWNTHSKARLEGCDPIDPDPDGQLARIRADYRQFLAAEDARPLPPLRSAPALPKLVM